jgi:hypothetical protein
VRIDGFTEEDNTILEETRIDVIDAFSRRSLIDDSRYEGAEDGKTLSFCHKGS